MKPVKPEEYAIVLVAESEDVIIVKQPICATCIEAKCKVTILRTWTIQSTDLSTIFRPEKAFDRETGKYTTVDTRPRFMKVLCVCRQVGK